MKQFSLSARHGVLPGPPPRRRRGLRGRHARTPPSRFERPGDYRIDVDANGNSRVQVRRGRAIAAAGGGQVPLSAGEEMDIDGTDAPRYDIVALPRPDGWDQWVERRDRQLAQAQLVHLRDGRHRRRRGPRPVRTMAADPGVRLDVVADIRRGRLGAVPRGTLDLAGPVGLDVGRGRAVGLGAVPLRALGLLRSALVLGARGAVRCAPSPTRPPSSRSSAASGGVRRLVPARAARSVLLPGGAAARP